MSLAPPPPPGQAFCVVLLPISRSGTANLLPPSPGHALLCRAAANILFPSPGQVLLRALSGLMHRVLLVVAVSPLLVVAPVDLLLQHDAVDAGLEQREHQAGLALQLAQAVEDVCRGRRGELVERGG